MKNTEGLENIGGTAVARVPTTTLFSWYHIGAP